MSNPSRRVAAASVFFAVLLCAPAAFATPGNAPSDPTKPETLRHGSRSKAADGTLVVYDKVNNLYVVPDRRDTYWVENKFFAVDGGVWASATEIKGPWKLVTKKSLPDVLLARHKPLTAPTTAKLPWGTEAVFEPRLRVYRVAGHKGVFLFDGGFYRYDNGLFFEADKEDGPWKLGSPRPLPVPLRKALPAPNDGQKVTLPGGETVVYDAKNQLFTVEDDPKLMLFEDTFYERRDEKWFASSSAKGEFSEVQPGKVPPPVRLRGRKVAAKDPAKIEEQRARKEQREKERKEARAKHGGAD